MAASCRNCGNWLQPRKMTCHVCGEITPNDATTVSIAAVSKAKTTTLDQVVAEKIERATVGPPWDECFGGGIVWASSTLIGGAPGSGKTTGLIQILSKLATLTGRRSYMISAEQAPGDIKITAERLQICNIDRFRVLSEFGAGADVDEELLKDDPPAAFLVDSVSALVGKDTHAAIMIARTYKKLAIKWKAPAFLICHMTKEHDYAGLMALQHEVDALMTIFPDDDGSRVLKSWKNRFGSTHNEYKLMMTATGLVAVPEQEEKKGKQKPLLGVRSTQEDQDDDDNDDRDDDDSDEEDDDAEEKPKARGRARVQVPDALEVNGQKLVRRPKKGEPKPETTSKARAVEGEALKKKRPPMPKKDAAATELHKPSLKASVKELAAKAAKVKAAKIAKAAKLKAAKLKTVKQKAKTK